jgi:hypothetical protein
MENRRRHYRHVFAPNLRPRVTLQSQASAQSVDAEIADLSIGGMRVAAEVAGEAWLATILKPAWSRAMKMHKLSVAAVDDLNAAHRVLAIMLEGFEAARDKAVAMERQGAIPPLASDRRVSLSA